ncbi:MAG: protein tyrosine phosphatase [Aeromonas sp.]
MNNGHGFNYILVVCVGNLCRSPLGAQLLQQQLPSAQVRSAGVAAVVGAPLAPAIVQLAANAQVKLGAHAATQLTAEMCLQADLILAMENAQLNAISALAPAARGKALLFGYWLAEHAQIADPYGAPLAQQREVVAQLIQSAAAWAQRLRPRA